jgi:hypothetical protein
VAAGWLLENRMPLGSNSAGIRRMNAPIRPSSSSIVQESVAKCEVVHTSVKIFPRIVGQASAIVWFLGFHDKKP